MGRDGEIMKVIYIDDITQEWLNELIEEGEIFVATTQDSILSQCSVVSRPVSSGREQTGWGEEQVRNK